MTFRADNVLALFRGLQDPRLGRRDDPNRGLIDDLPANFVVDDTAYDAGRFRGRLAKRGTATVIPNNPTRANR